jgi:hypothetical protein
MTYIPDNLVTRGGACILGKSGTLKSGQGVLPRGAVLGAISRALDVISAVVGTGTGTITGVAMKPETKIGTYVITCITAVGNGGIFKVVDPDGFRLADATVGVPYTNSQIAFTLNDVGTDFIVGDHFTIPVIAGSGKFVLLDKAAVDGSADPESADMVVLAAATDTTADAVAPLYQCGAFNKSAVTFAAGTSAADYLQPLLKRNIYLEDVQATFSAA